jgi:serine/threonine-protein kinase
MAMTDLGACEWFVWDLRRSNLIDRGQLDQIVGDFLKKHPRAEPPELSKFLVAEGIISEFQAERLLQGKTQGLVLGPYTLLDALGTGSLGTVYKAQSKNDNNWYAVKVLPRRSMWNVRIARRQVRAFEQCKHPTVVPFVDVGTSGGTHYLAWPLVEGTNLEKLVQEKGPLPHGLVAHYMVQVCEGLDICHQNNLVHGLLKPSNLLIGSDHSVKILDFGIGSLLAESEGESLVDTMSTANSLTSGLDCGSPESILEPTKRTPAGDQYSLGCTMYFCLTGQYPFPEGTAVEKMMAHQTKKPTPIKELNPNVPNEIVAIVERLMQKKPEDRYSRTADVIEELKPFASTNTRGLSSSRTAPGRAPASATATTPARSPANGTREPAATAPAAPPQRRPDAPPAPPPHAAEDDDVPTIEQLRQRAAQRPQTAPPQRTAPARPQPQPPAQPPARNPAPPPNRPQPPAAHDDETAAASTRPAARLPSRESLRRGANPPPPPPPPPQPRGARPAAPPPQPDEDPQGDYGGYDPERASNRGGGLEERLGSNTMMFLMLVVVMVLTAVLTTILNKLLS